MTNSRNMRWVKYVVRMRWKGNAYQVLVERPEGKRPVERPKRTWEDNIRMDLKGNWMGWYVLDSSGLG
jgi:hypothetical protein